MKPKYLNFSIVATVLIVTWCACTDVKPIYSFKLKSQKLSPDDLYDADLVSDAVFNLQEENVDSLQKQANLLFNRAIVEFDNTKDLSHAVKAIKASILIYPSSNAYYELGKLLIQNNRITDAVKAFEVAERLKFKPIYTLHYNMAVAYSKISPFTEENEINASRFLSSALLNGLKDTLQISKNSQLAKIYNSSDFKQFIIDEKAGKIKNDPKKLFQLFSGSFAMVKQPFEISSDNLSLKKYKMLISYNFARFIPGMSEMEFSRDVSDTYYYVAKIAETTKYDALVYSSTPFSEEEMQPVTTTLAVYNKEGKSISNLVIGCDCSTEQIKKARIENNVIVVEEYKRIWKYPIDEVELKENSVVQLDLISSKEYTLEADGKIHASSGNKDNSTSISKI